MNYRRIEMIFLITFLLLNIYLGFNLYEDNKEEAVNKMETVSDIEKILERDKIKYPKTISDKRTEGYYLSAQKTDFDHDVKQLKHQHATVTNGVVTSTLDKGHQVKLNTDFLSAINAFDHNKENVIKGSDYQYYAEESTKKVLMYTQMYHDMPIVDETARIEYDIQHDKVVKYRQTHIDNIEEMRDAQPLISSRDAIFTLYTEGKLANFDHIRWARLAYNKIYTLNQTYVYAPTWQISIRHSSGLEEIERVNAMTNRLVMNGIQENRNN